MPEKEPAVSTLYHRFNKDDGKTEGVLVQRYDVRNSHVYLLRDPLTDTPGMELPSVTSLLGMLPKPWMFGFAAKKAITALERGLEANLYGDALVDRVRTDTYAKSEMAYGSDAHEWLAKVATGELAVGYIPEHLMEAGALLEDWLLENGVAEVVAVEQAVADSLNSPRWAGTYDMHVRFEDGSHGVYDFKFTSGIYPEMLMQAAAYRYALGRCLDIEVRHFGVLRFPSPTNDGAFQAVSLDTHETDDYEFALAATAVVASTCSLKAFLGDAEAIFENLNLFGKGSDGEEG